MSSAGSIELHYYLSDGAHSMDAMLRNRCEAELLALFIEVASNLGVSTQIEAQALAEGGLREIWKWLGENATQVNVILTVVMVLITLKPDSDSEQEILNKALMKLSIEEKQLQIERLRKELGEVEPRSESAVSANAVELLKRDPKIVVRRSNFYKQLTGNSKIEFIGVTPFDSRNQPILPEKKIPRDDFRLFILSTHSLDPVIYDDATIEIISPVLREGSYKWKGIFEKEPINFTMQDLKFKGQVLREEITFQHGTFLECVLHVHRKLDEVGEVEITGWVVTTVLRKYDDRQSVETSQGRDYKQAKRLRDSQNDFFGR